MLDLAQFAAWARMFVGYASTESLADAARETFDPGKPCAICKAVDTAREASGRHGPAVPSAGVERLILIFERVATIIGAPEKGAWPMVGAASAKPPSEDVPVPPPKPALV
jgi:hypothetical protein